MKCDYCRKNIKKKDKQTVLTTKQDGKTKGEPTYYHFNCWISYFNECVEKKAKKNIIKQIKDNPIVKNIIGSDKTKKLITTFFELMKEDEKKEKK